ncbi:hypothetical protein [Comamonas sp. MYb396]|uniref:hypothetical protein n=1 Tax=Comamonas sp. MYb396 TaxID=2745302 RepID=UPI0030B620D6
MIETPYQIHSDTSRSAAEAIADGAHTFKAKVLDAIQKAGVHGMTDEECAHKLMIGPNTQRPRRVKLVEEKLVVDSGQRRKTLGGRNAIVWVSAQIKGNA